MSLAQSVLLSKMSEKYRNFRWTLNVDAFIWHDILLEHFAKHVSFREVVFQGEIAPQTGHAHYQGFLALKGPYTCRSLAASMNPHVKPHSFWFGKADKPDAAREYARKEDTRAQGPWTARAANGLMIPARSSGPARGAEGGGQGARTDLELFRDDIKAGMSDADLWEKHVAAMARYPRMPASVRGATAVRRTWKPEVHIYYGAPGTGKSRRANDLAPTAYRKVPGMWWDLYQGEPDVIMDDFYGTTAMEYSEFLKFVDYYDYSAQVKGGMIKINPRRVFITSNTHPSMWYTDFVGYNAKAFFRRISSITQFLEDGTTVDYDPTLYYPIEY